MTRHAPGPTFHDLDPDEVNALLARNHVGRIAYSFHDRVDIEPISYVFADGAIYMRTAPGSKLSTLAHAPWVAFEVDEARGPFDWRSVVVHGTVYVLHDTGSRIDRATYQHAVSRLRQLTPEAFGGDDPTPTRRVVVKFYPDVLQGRAARTAPPIEGWTGPDSRKPCAEINGGIARAPDAARNRHGPARSRSHKRGNAGGERRQPRRDDALGDGVRWFPRCGGRVL